MEVSVYIMRADKDGIVYQGYQAQVEARVLEGNYIYPLGRGVGIVCVEDAVVMGEPLNRAVYGGNGEFQTVLAGNLAAVRHDGECFSDIQEEDVIFIEESLKPIERIAYGKVFLKGAGSLPVWERRR